MDGISSRVQFGGSLTLFYEGIHLWLKFTKRQGNSWCAQQNYYPIHELERTENLYFFSQDGSAVHLKGFAGVDGFMTADSECDAAIDHVTENMEPMNPFPSVVVSYLFTAISMQKESKIVAVKHARLKLDLHRLGLEKEDRRRTGRGGLHLVGWEESELLLLGLAITQHVVLNKETMTFAPVSKQLTEADAELVHENRALLVKACKDWFGIDVDRRRRGGADQGDL